MKNRLLIVGVIVLTVSLPIAAWAATSSPSPATEAKSGVEKLPMVGVDVLLRAPDKYQGTVLVRGVVSAVYPKDQRLGLLDAIYLNCCSSPCGSPQALPVKWTGDMPMTKALVLVTGEIRRTGDKLEFVAKSLEKVEPTGGAAK